MNRVDKPCCGDCAQCTLLNNGDVDMIPCVLDQIFRRLQRLESVAGDKAISIAAECEPIKKNRNVQKDD